LTAPGIQAILDAVDPAKGGLTRSTAVRRALDQLAQELAVSRVRAEVHPILKARVADIGIPKHLVKKVLAVVYEKAERLTRKGVHQRLREAFDAVAESLTPPGTATAFEAGAALQEDAYGFVVQEGGYDGYMGALDGYAPVTMRSTNMRRMLDQLLQELVLVGARKKVFPMLEQRVDSLGLPPIGGIQETVPSSCLRLHHSRTLHPSHTLHHSRGLIVMACGGRSWQWPSTWPRARSGRRCTAASWGRTPR
jgi:hypothetical protein